MDYDYGNHFEFQNGHNQKHEIFCAIETVEWQQYNSPRFGKLRRNSEKSLIKICTE
jgi:hypothetical protein